MGNSNTSTGGTGDITNTGYYPVKNIYDLAGNVEEWTLEASRTYSRFTRGDSYDYSNIKANYRNDVTPEYANDDKSSRFTLY